MPIYYADADTGNDGNGGTSWTDAKLTVNGVEDIPVAAGDTVYSRGTFRETLTCDVSGAVEWDGLGQTRITGSDNDRTATRAFGINGNGQTGRIFRGLSVDSCTTYGINITGNDWVINDCNAAYNADSGIFINSGITGVTIQRCALLFNKYGLTKAGAAESNVTIALTNLKIINNYSANIYVSGAGGITIRNILTTGSLRGFYLASALPAAQTITIENSLVFGNYNGLQNVGGDSTDVVEDYNGVTLNNTNLAGITSGGHSQTYLPQFALPRLIDGYRYSWQFGQMAGYSGYAAIVGSGVPVDDFHGFDRAAPSSWGPCQYEATRRDSDAGEPRGRRGV